MIKWIVGIVIFISFLFGALVFSFQIGHESGYEEGLTGILEYGEHPLYVGLYAGTSMAQKGFDGEHNKYFYYKEECNEGDVCVFTCDKCKTENGDKSFIKEVIAKKDGCFWFEGNQDFWQEDGEVKQSHDSRSFGWVCEGEYTDMQRVVR
jgi:hypothetical protein